MVSEAWFNGSSLDQLEAIIDLRDSLQLTYPELESVTSHCGINDPRIFPYLGSDPAPPKIEKYSNRVLKILETPIREDYVRIALENLAIPIKDDYLRLALNSLATPIREDYLRLAMNNISKSIKEDYLRLVMEALIKAIREDCLRSALSKFNDKGFEAKPTVSQVTGLIQGNTDFIKYSPSKGFDLLGDEKIRYIELKEIGQNLGDIVTVLDRKMYKIPLEEKLERSMIDFSLYTNGSIGTDGYYESRLFNINSVEHLYLPVYCEYSPTKEKVPRDYWIAQARDILDTQGWTLKNVRNISRESFRTYKGKKPSMKVICRMRYSLCKEIEKRKQNSLG